MALKIIEFNEHIQDKNGGVFEFRYEGIEKNSNVDTIKVKDLINKFMYQITYHGDMIRNVRFLRTILKDYDEKLLFLSYQNDEISETVSFNNSHMFSFAKSVKNKRNKHNDNFIVKYTPGGNINFMFTDSENNIINYANIEYMPDRITKVLKEIYSLNDTNSIKLDLDAKIIIEIYKLFYKENPDFSDKNINIKIQTMMSILGEFGITVDDYYGFLPYGKKQIPMCLNLANLVYELFPLGEITYINDPVELAKEPKKKIQVIGECIRSAIENASNQEDVLITISKVIHAARYNLSNTASIGDIANYINCTENEVESSMKLIKKINNHITN